MGKKSRRPARQHRPSDCGTDTETSSSATTSDASSERSDDCRLVDVEDGQAVKPITRDEFRLGWQKCERVALMAPMFLTRCIDAINATVADRMFNDNLRAALDRRGPVVTRSAEIDGMVMVGTVGLSFVGEHEIVGQWPVGHADQAHGAIDAATRALFVHGQPIALPGRCVYDKPRGVIYGCTLIAESDEPECGTWGRLVDFAKRHYTGDARPRILYLTLFGAATQSLSVPHRIEDDMFVYDGLYG